MDRHQLATQLRHRQLTHPQGIVHQASHLGLSDDEAREACARLSDDDLIDSYIRCANCGALMLDKHTNAAMIWRAHTAQEWLDLTSDLAIRHAEKGGNQQ